MNLDHPSLLGRLVMDNDMNNDFDTVPSATGNPE